MCLTIVGQIAYGAVMLVALALTLGGMFTPEWRKYANQQNLDGTAAGVGLFSFACKIDNLNACAMEFQDQPTWQKVVVACLILGALAQALAVAWAVVTFFACCCKKHVLHPLTGFAVLASILIVIGVAVYALRYKEQIGSFWNQLHQPNLNFGSIPDLGYSFFLCCGSLAASVVGIVIGSLTACFGDRGI
ncbi:Protein CLC-1 [Aphelenchoides avenae]|nr:Protein CLC-1 [Aphelenchus avenae]